MEEREHKYPQQNARDGTQDGMRSQAYPTHINSCTEHNPDEFKGGQKVCNFYTQGKCRFGAACRFYHDPNLVVPNQQPRQERSSHPRASPHRNPYSSTHTGRGNNRNPGLAMNVDYSNAMPPASFSMAPVPMQMPMSLPPPPQYLSQSMPSMQSIPQYNSGNPYPNQYGMIPAPALSIPQPIPYQPPPRNLLTIPPNVPIYCIDVECVATGIQHNARSVAQVAMVDQWNRVIFNAYIKQEVPIVSYLTEIHGITKELLEEQGIPLADALAELRSRLSPDAILIGQSIHKDIHWLQLAEGMDYHSCINLSDLFRVWNPKHNAYTNFSLDHCAKAWLGIDRTSHEAIEDAIISMTLFNTYRNVQYYPLQFQLLQQRTLDAPRIPGFSALHPVIDGCW